MDTSAYARLGEGVPAVVKAIEFADEVYLSAVTLGELTLGFHKGTKYRENIKELEEFLSAPGIEVLPVGRQTADCYAFIRRDLQTLGLAIPANDLWIAAGAMELGLRLLTADRHFTSVRQIQVDLLDSLD